MEIKQFGTNNRLSPLDRLQDLSKMSKNAIFVLLFSIILLMGLSRMILGVHFLDQVIFGYILGFITLAFVKEVIWPLFVQNVQNHKEKGKTQ